MELRAASSSGGIFSELARNIIDAGGAVAGCVWEANWTPVHILTQNWSDVERMRGSKYAPSRADNIYQQVLDFLRKTDKPVLFSGAPCQVAALVALLKPEFRPRVLLVDFICHGVPSLTVLHSYLKGLFNGDDVVSYTCRDKTLFWETIRAKSSSGKSYLLEGYKDPFFSGFCIYHLYLMEACHNCEFTNLPRRSDVTLSDYWNCPPEWYDLRGVSFLMASSEKGLKALQDLKITGRIELRKTDLETALRKRRQLSGNGYPIPRHRRAFLDAIANGASFQQAQKSCFPSWLELWFKGFRKSESKARYIQQYAFAAVRKIGRIVIR